MDARTDRATRKPPLWCLAFSAMEDEADRVEETLVEMAYRWPEIEGAIAADPDEPWIEVPNDDRETRERHPEVPIFLSAALERAFHVEASLGEVTSHSVV